jgi:acyl carrier protein
MHDITQVLKSILIDELDLGLDAVALTETTPLLEDGLDLDSIVIVEFVGIIEDRFGFQFDDTDLRTSSFQDLTTLARIVQKRTSNLSRT